MSANFSIRPVASTDRQWVSDVIKEWWAAEFVVMRGESHTPGDLPGFLAEVNRERIGLVTYRIDGDWCEVVTVNSLREGIGVGTAMLEAVKQSALEMNCKRLSVVTTNDNLHALRFYQRHGWRITAAYPGAVDRTRETLKPNIPAIGANGIPLRDEIELDLPLRG